MRDGGVREQMGGPHGVQCDLPLPGALVEPQVSAGQPGPACVQVLWCCQLAHMGGMMGAWPLYFSH